MLGSMKKAILVKYAMTPNRIINKTSDFEYHIAKQSGLAIWLKKGGSIMSKTSMSVMEMGKSLGLGKTESYWLVHKEQFETRFVAGKMRVMVDSFERWYANQLHYKKISGELPGKELLKRTMTVPTMAKLLGIKEANAYELIHRLHFRSVKTEYSSQRLLIDKATFNEWLKKQTHYKIVEGKEDFYDRAELSEVQ